ncbi:MAG: hypothetical protein WCX19_04620 [Methanoregula sp.]
MELFLIGIKIGDGNSSCRLYDAGDPVEEHAGVPDVMKGHAADREVECAGEFVSLFQVHAPDDDVFSDHAP